MRISHYLLGFTLLFTVSAAALDTSESSSTTPATESPDARALLLKAVQAIGPPAEFDAIESLEMIGQSWTVGEDDPEPATTEMLFIYPDGLAGLWMHSRHENSEGKAFVRTLAGDRSWTARLGVLSEELHGDAVRYASTKLLTLLRYRDHEKASAEWQGMAEVAGEIVDLVAVELYGNTSILEIARSTGRVTGIRFPSSEIQEGVAAQEVRRAYGDYRKVGTLELPFLQEVTVDGEPFSRWQLEEIRVDVPYEPSLLSPGE